MNVQNAISFAWPGWKVVREIGAGTRSSVYLITKQLSRPVRSVYRAVRVLKLPGNGSLTRAEENPLREEVLMKRYSGHPNFVRLFDSSVVKENSTGDRYLLLQEEALLPLEEYRGYDMLRLGADICSALSSLHKDGWYHLDVKPDNIFVTAEGTFKLGDFGAARNRDELSQVKLPGGTRHYAAPEMKKTENSAKLNAAGAIKADLFSLGTVLFEMTFWMDYGRGLHGSGDEPHEREEWFSTHLVRAQWEYSWRLPFREHPKEIIDVIRGAIDFDPVKRYGTADAMRAALLSLIGKGDALPKFCFNNPEQSTSPEKTIHEPMRQFLGRDVRSLLILVFPDGRHRPIPSHVFTEQNSRKDYDPHIYFGIPQGFRVAYYGKDPPVSVRINGKEIEINSDAEETEIVFSKLYAGRSVPMDLDIEATYAHQRKYRWFLTQKPPKHWRDWWKCPDWT
ncbi:MAG: serine/threonine protein kinase [Clostridia bacterium]|nr:serine/threonine protein kinase [Clostridia bacterium]